jgi:hypothetical protein
VGEPLRTITASRQRFPRGIVTYRLDRHDVITDCGGVWDRFARENGVLSLRSDAVVGRSIWDFVTGATTRQLWRDLFRGARRRGRVTVPLRCDSPTARREAQMIVDLHGDGELWISSAVTSEQARPRMDWLTGGPHLSDSRVRTCSWCRRFSANGQWLEVENAAQRLGLATGDIPQVAHGVCPTCEARLRLQLR